MKNHLPLYLTYITIILALAIWSGIHPVDRAIWFFEAFPALIGILLLSLLYKRYPFTPMAYLFAFIAALFMLLASHYTYEEVPIQLIVGGMERNHFDRLGHVFQGIVVTLFLREIFIRENIVAIKYLTPIVIILALGFAAGYELVEFLSGLIKGGNLEEFLGYQGDPWDSHWDMICALLGSIFFLCALAPLHLKQVKKI
ncbi:DUF2238 domain-containing protein [Mechercharimyces sp. CAU 1602]|uniref:DUF2238 domain-containing protein n=1 Tax=Mechercharimyces sp. CAU 1602 TaxID=2973933 RepID=UPI002161654C|nr:DUF2238 domain-containing protein [Mechercharimyces sp. CAU 1602]MCS1350936.1 DUF2238 domain-containing protein [Mechercharimyces sp. CAU 1602]